ncbi:MAG: hypothetical protein EOM34_04510 [Clostridia bacterium]|nr:hypothetical protein [Clostridia bacterium]NCD04044.1 hypothetical protein [Clostridia bacterium]
MKRKIIALYSYSITIASGASAIALPWITTEVLPCCLWVLAVLTAMAGLLWLYKNAPVERELRQGAQRKLYNFILSEKEEGVK